MRILIACLVAFAAAAAAADLPADLVVTQAPEGAANVIATKATAKPGDPVIIRGRVGGRAQPFVAGRAVMALVDASATACDAIPGDNCAKPWDYCCEDRETLKAALAMVQVIDDVGRPLAAGLEGAGGLKAGDRVVVVGTVAAGSNAESLVVNANRLYIEPHK